MRMLRVPCTPFLLASPEMHMIEDLYWESSMCAESDGEHWRGKAPAETSLGGACRRGTAASAFGVPEEQVVLRP